jgi:hypothetical protein
MRFVLLILLVAQASAETVTQNLFTLSQNSDCGGIECGDAFSFNAQQLSPSAGALLEIDFTFFDSEQVDFNYPSIVGPEHVQGQVSSSLLPIFETASESFPACPTSFCDATANLDFSASGTTLSDAFTGNGTVLIPFEASDFGGHFIDLVSDRASLQLTYIYTPVPEPEQWPLIVAALALLAALRGRLFEKMRGA